MIIIPAIDLRGGSCVRLFRGSFDDETVYSKDPITVAKRWKDDGASIIHIVDLDGARDGKPTHLPVIEKIISQVGVDVEVGGGIRDAETVEKYISAGVKRVILGTAVTSDPDFVKQVSSRFSGAIYAGVDAKNKKVAVKGWIEETGLEAGNLINMLADYGVAGVIYTDIMKDGTLEGIDTNHLNTMIAETKLPFVVSGGVSTLDDIKKLKALNNPQIEGVITGKALYAGAFELKDAIKIVGN